jgi:H+/gluconate symporter-like permease
MTQSNQVLTRKGIRGSPLFIAVAAAGALALAACATPPQPPTQALQAAESAIANAEQSRVADYASAELTIAREKLTAARAATRNNEMAQAEFLAIESRTHAELAYAQAEELKAKAVNDEMQKSIDTLKKEMERARGARQ